MNVLRAQGRAIALQVVRNVKELGDADVGTEGQKYIRTM